MTTKITVHVSTKTLEDAKHQQGANFKPGICALLTDGCTVEVETGTDTITFNTPDEFAAWFDGATAKPATEERRIPASVRKIRLSGAVDVVVRQGPQPKMTIHCARAADLPKVLTRVEGDCLIIDNEPMTIIMTGLGGGMQQYVGCTVGQVTQCGSIVNYGNNQITVGHGNIQISGVNVIGGDPAANPFRIEVTLPEVSSLRISGAGDMTYLGLRQDELSLGVSGAGNIVVAGAVAHLEADVSGAGKIRAFELNAETAHLLVSGAGDIQATVSRSIRARVSGVGKIKIAGNPPERDTDVSGIGKIKFVQRTLL